MRNYLYFIFLLLLCLSCISKNGVDKRPNIIFLMDDQHRWDALGVVNRNIITPHIDRLASQGVRFSQAVCQAPMCIASRNSMMLGLYPNQIGILRNEPGLADEYLPSIPLPQLFSDAGYATAGFGKTHWGIECSTRGFQTRYASELREEGAILMKDVDPIKKQHYDDETKDYGPGEEDPSGYIGQTSGIPEDEHRDGWVLEKCIDYLEQRNDERPLFLYLSFMKPHAGHNVPIDYEDHYDLEETTYAEQPPWEKDQSPHASNINRREKYIDFWKNATVEQWKLMTMRYYANCTWIDDMFGRALHTLRDKGLLDNALIIYVSDHGEMLGERFYRFNKYCLYESSVRVPIIISGTALPVEMKQIVDNRPAELVDIYPTLLHTAGIKIPENVPGINLFNKEENREASFCSLHEREFEASFMWRTIDYKLILQFERKPDASNYKESDIIGGEFYDLQNDAQEWVDLYGNKEFIETKKIMTKQLINHLKRVAPVMPLKNH